MDPVDTPKPITTDPDEVELLQSMDIPLTDPNAKADVDETAVAAQPETDDVEGSDGTDVAGGVGDAADAPGEPAAAAAETDGGGSGGEEGTPAGDGGSDGDADVPPVPPAQPAVATTTAPSDAAKRLAEVEAAILADDYDPYSKEGRQLQLEHNKLAAKVEAEPLYADRRQAEAWATYTRQFPDIPQQQMQAAWTKQKDVYAKRGLVGDALQAAATVALEHELQQIANGKKGGRAAAAAAQPAKPTGAKVAPPVAKTPITPKGAIVAPPAATPVAAPKQHLSDEEELVAFNRKHNPRGLRGTLGR